MKKIITIIIVLSTVVLGIVAIITAYNMWQRGNQPIAPNVPESQPKAEERTSPTNNSNYQPQSSEETQRIPPAPCALAFSITEPGSTPSPTIKNCQEACTLDTDCKTGLTCETVFGSRICVNSACNTETDCECPQGVTPTITQPPSGSTPTPTTTAPSTPAPELPQSGNTLLTFGALITGILVLGMTILLLF